MLLDPRLNFNFDGSAWMFIYRGHKTSPMIFPLEHEESMRRQETKDLKINAEFRKRMKEPESEGPPG